MRAKRVISVFTAFIMALGIVGTVSVQVMAALAARVTVWDSVQPAVEWTDTSGNFIQAHSGSVIWLDDEDGGRWWWYGEDKTEGVKPIGGVHAYTSTDLYNWEDRGIVFQVAASLSDFDSDPILAKAYAGYTDEEKQWVLYHLDKNFCVVERPKVLYNELTGKYVMWFHSDGPTEEAYNNRDDGASRYSRAMAAVAVSDSPDGPFTFVGASRLYSSEKYTGTSPGMARDETVFVDDDGTAYFVYSSEGNNYLYIAMMNDTYTGLVTDEDYWVLDESGRPVEEDGALVVNESYEFGAGADEGVEGTHFAARINGDAVQREAPCLFKYNGKYYIFSSQCDGWNSSTTFLYMTDDLFETPWTFLGSPFVGSSSDGHSWSESFDSQSTFVIPYDAENGLFIFMGDRHYDPTYYGGAALGDSRYIWLPVQIGGDGDMTVRWYDEWTTGMLEDMVPFSVDPIYAIEGTRPDALGGTVDVVLTDGSTKTLEAEWDDAEIEAALKTPGTHTVTASFPRFGNGTRTQSVSLYVVPDELLYFVNPAGDGSSMEEYEAIVAFGGGSLLNTTNDHAYEGNAWGYVAGSHVARTGTDLFSSLRYVSGNSNQTLTYRFDDLEAGEYDIYIGFYDPWSASTTKRYVTTKVNGSTVESGRQITGDYESSALRNITHGGGMLEIALVPENTGQGADVQFSWMMIAPSAHQMRDDTPVEVLEELDVLATFVDQTPNLPASVAVRLNDGTETDAAVSWLVDATTFATAYETVAVAGVIEGSLEANPLTVTQLVEVVPESVVYFIDSNSPASPLYQAVAGIAANLENEAGDQQYDGTNDWGYVNDSAEVTGYSASNPNDKYIGGWYANANKSITYVLELEAGAYRFTAGAHEWWGTWNASRPMSASLKHPDGTVETLGSIPLTNAADISVSHYVTLETGGTVEYTVSKSGTLDPVLSWLAVDEIDETALLDDTHLGTIATYVGEIPQLPQTVELDVNGTSQTYPVEWPALTADMFSAAFGAVTLEGTVTGTGLTATITVEIVPEDLVYFIDSNGHNYLGGGEVSPAWVAVDELTGGALVNRQADQSYTGSNGWGVSSNVTARTGGLATATKWDKTGTTGWYGSTSSSAITYTLDLPAGAYEITSGHYEWWNNLRSMKVTLTYNKGGVPVTETVRAFNLFGVTGNSRTARYSFVLDAPGAVQYTVTPVTPSGTAVQAPVISWLAVEQLPYDELAETYLGYFAAYQKTSETSLPKTIRFVHEGEAVERAISWNVDDTTFPAAYEVVPVTGTIQGTDIEVTAKVEVVREGVQYYIDLGYPTTNTNVNVTTTESIFYNAVSGLANLCNGSTDAAYDADAGWGYVDGSITAKGNVDDFEDKYATGRYTGNADLVYRLELEAGVYSFDALFRDWWWQNRPMRVVIRYENSEGVTVSETVDTISLSTTSRNATSSVQFYLPESATVEYVVQKTGSNDPVLNWLAVSAVEVVEAEDIVVATYEGEVPTLPSALETTVNHTNTRSEAVVWDTVDASSFGTAYQTVAVNGTLAESGVAVTAYVEVVPADVVYYIDMGYPTTGVEESLFYNAVADLHGSLANGATDQLYNEPDGWGYLDAANLAPKGSVADFYSKFSTARMIDANGASQISYTLTLPAGGYRFTSGHREFWGQYNTSRPVDVTLTYTDADGQETTETLYSVPLTSTSGDLTVSSDSITLPAGEVTVTFKSGGASAVGPLVSWLVVNGEEDIPLDYTALEALVDEIAAALADESLAEADHTASSWAVLTSALDAANALLQDKDAAGQDAIDAVKHALQDALDALVDISALRERVAEIVTGLANLAESDYVASTWTALQAALTGAHAVLASPAATTGDVNGAIGALNAAWDGLTELALTSIAVTGIPAKHTVGDFLDLSGLTVTAYYNDGTDRVLASGEYTTDAEDAVDLNTADVYTVTVTYAEKGVTRIDTFTLEVEAAAVVEKLLQGITLVSGPDKAEYFVGEALETEGLVVTAQYNDPYEDADITDAADFDYDFSVADDASPVIVSYTEGDVTKTLSFTVKVVAAPVPATLTGISITGTPAVHALDSTLDLSGLEVTAHYSNDTSRVLDDGEYTTDASDVVDTSLADSYLVTVGYNEGGVTETATFALVVSDKVLESISIESLPAKTEYLVGEDLETEGLVVMASYGALYAPEDITGLVNIVYNFSVTDDESLVTVTYGGEIATFTVKVSEVPVIPAVLQSIYVAAAPSKTEYTVGDTLDTTGLVVLAVYSDGSEVDITGKAGLAIVYDFSKAGTRLVTLAFEGKQSGFNVTVKAAIPDPNPDPDPNPTHAIISGGNASHSGGSSHLVVAIDADHTKLVAVYFGGEKLEQDTHYTVAAGSTYVTLLADYLNTLAAGTYTLEIEFENATVTTTITILRDTSDAMPDTSAAGTTDTTGTVATGDNGLAIPVLLGIIAFAGLVSMVLIRRKRTN